MPLLTQVHRPGVITARKGRNIVVQLSPESLKSVCTATGCSGCTKNFTPLKITLPSPGKNAEPGMHVLVYLPVLHEAFAAFLVFILPLCVSGATYGALLFFLIHHPTTPFPSWEVSSPCCFPCCYSAK
ncbi:hypothetical protein CALK_1624 [Chitinivibrio alkaliphilus ACht1]|uniref:Uncharacterized protein n=1 Tax=Chitinivibrio alkaliphilus ACht1 TaxID=1313304 RepID=U7DAK3_9BACT|nr:hypothetical protein CALK_1624 [Chitinivibrio alkaliphilus ACht1]